MLALDHCATGLCGLETHGVSDWGGGKMRGHFAGYVASATLFLASAVAAQDGAAPTIAPGNTAACELHVWPGSGLNSVYYGWLHGGINNGAVTGRSGYPVVPTSEIDTPIQVRLLTEAQPQMLLNQPNDRLFVHSEALPSRVIRNSTARIGPQDSACYRELIVDDVFFQQDVFTGSYLRILFRFRDFGSAHGNAAERTFSTSVQTKLLTFPAKTPDQFDAATEELHRAFKNDISLFAQALLKPPKVKK